jgi:hypothetical protein
MTHTGRGLERMQFHRPQRNGFWKTSAHQLLARNLFVYFAPASWMFAISSAVLGLVAFADEKRPFVFPVRLLGFGAIRWASSGFRAGRCY